MDECPACKYDTLYTHIREVEQAVGERQQALQEAGSSVEDDVTIDSMMRDREETMQELMDVGKYMADGMHRAREMAKNAILN